MRYLAILVAAVTLWAAPAAAQEAPDAARQSHLDLAARYLELTQGGDLVKLMRSQMESNLASSGMPADQRTWMTDNFGDMFGEVIALTLVELRDDVADSFTVQELETAIAFYSSPIGRSVVRKQVDMNVEIQEVMTPLMMPRVTSLMEKFCLRFDCSALGESAAKEFR